MKKKIKAVIAATIAVLFCGGASACGDFFDGLKDVQVTATEWKKAFAFDYTHYQIDASFIPENGEQETQKVKLEKDGDVMCVSLTEGSEDEGYDYSVYAARVANDYKKYEKDETGAWRATNQTKESYKEYHASTIVDNLLKEISYSDFIYSAAEYSYSYTKALPTGENAATYTVEFLNNRIVELNIEIKIAPITFTFMGEDVEMEKGTLACTFAYEDKELILPSVTSSNNTDSQVTAEEWYAALNLYDEENVQIAVMRNNEFTAQLIKDDNWIHYAPVNVTLGEEEMYIQINEDGETLKEYRKDETGAWELYDYQNSDYNAPGNGLGSVFNFLGGANVDTYSRFTYDEEEGVYSFTADGGFGLVAGSQPDAQPKTQPETQPETLADTEEESEVTTTISLRFSNKKLVEIVIKTGTETEMEEVVVKYTYYVQNVTLPTVPTVPEDEDDDKITEAEWEKALDLTAFATVQVHTTSSDGASVVIKKHGDVVYACAAGEGRVQEVYYKKDGDAYKQFYRDSEMSDWIMQECSASQYESLVPLNLNNRSLCYDDFTYDESVGGYSRTQIVGESQQTIVLKFLDKRLVVIEDGTGAELMSIDYEDVELTLPMVNEDTETIS